MRCLALIEAMNLLRHIRFGSTLSKKAAFFDNPKSADQTTSTAG